MKLDIKEILSNSVIFTSIFLKTASYNKSFINLLLGFIYSSKLLLETINKLNLITYDQIVKIEEQLSNAAKKDLDSNNKLVEFLKERLIKEENNG